MDGQCVQNPNKELHNLRRCQIFGPFNDQIWIQCFRKKVRVHESMDAAVQQEDNEQPGTLTDDTSPHEEYNTNVMVNLKEGGFFALKYKDPCVDKFVILGPIENSHPTTQTTVIPKTTVVITIHGFPSSRSKVINDDWPRIDATNERKDCQQEIMNCHTNLEYLGGFSIKSCALYNPFQHWFR
mmetsp:Transcript_2859/g.3926  ORF Transcript_2859/g.3926 Transcript_2859/m.3926 type:complete len:183 (-) Transcript_2859:253-801(-)